MIQRLTDRIRPLLTGAVSLSDLDSHTRQALDIYAHFRASAIIDLPPEQIKAEIEKMPEGVSELIRNKDTVFITINSYQSPANNGSVGVGLIGGREMKPVVFESRIDERRSAKVEAGDYGAHVLTMNNGSQWSGAAIYSVEVAESAIKVLQQYVDYAKAQERRNIKARAKK